MRRRLIRWRCGGVALCLWACPAPGNAIPVFDGTNYAQNVLQAARALEQINNQIRSLQNEAIMLQNMATNLEHLDFSSLAQISQDLANIGQLVQSAQGIGFQVAASRQQFAALFSSGAIGTSTASALSGATARLQAAQAAFQQSIALQSQIAVGAQNDVGTLSSLLQKSQSANGNLQTAQVTNQLLALVAKQQAELQQLMAAQSRAQSIQQSSELQAEEEARAATRRFLGSGKAYTPQ
jgi:type IV secretion system protein TrbJ